jgi:hypothetical protein
MSYPPVISLIEYVIVEIKHKGTVVIVHDKRANCKGTPDLISYEYKLFGVKATDIKHESQLFQMFKVNYFVKD